MVTMVEFKLNVSDKRQILIPKLLRDRYGVKEGDMSEDFRYIGVAAERQEAPDKVRGGRCMPGTSICPGCFTGRRCGVPIPTPGS